MVDFTKFTTEELEETLKNYKDQIATMIMNTNITKLIAEVEVIEFVLKSRKENGQETTSAN